VTLDAKGSPYRTTTGGGASGEGTVFRLMPGRERQWTKTELYNFCASPLYSTFDLKAFNPVTTAAEAAR